MALYSIDEKILKNIGKAIRAKNGKDTTYKPSQMPAAIRDFIDGTEFHRILSFFLRQGEEIDEFTLENDPEITEIGDYAFFNHNKVKKIIANNISTIGVQAFGGSNSHIEEVEALNCQVLKSKAFFENQTIRSINMPELKTIENGVFRNCSNLSSIDLSKIETIPAQAFYSCSNLSSINIPNIKNIGDYAFCYCRNITSINIPKCENIGSYAFHSCSNLSFMSLSNCTRIGSYAFLNCQNLSSINALNCSIIGEGAFQLCRKLEKIDFPLCQVVNPSTFLRCENLMTINLPGCKTIKSYAFSSCYSLSSILFPNCVNIQNYTFCNCSNLQSISLPKCETIGTSAFYNCSNLQSISLPKCETIGISTFYNCSNLQSIFLPECKTIGSYAFYDCKKLSLISIPNCVYIYNYAFGDCYSLSTPIVFPSSISYINYYAFYNCSSLSEVTFLSKTSNMYLGTIFSYCSNLKDIYVPWSENEVSNAPWGANNATIHYNTTSQDLLGIDITGNNTIINKIGSSFPIIIKYKHLLNQEQKGITWVYPSYVSISQDNILTLLEQQLNGTQFTVIANSTFNPSFSSSFTTTIINAYFNINLNNQWRDSGTVSNNGDIIYESFSNYHISSSTATVIITFAGYNKVVLQVRSYGQSNYDYLIASNLNQHLSSGTYFSTYGKSSSNIYTELIYNNLDPSKEYFIQIGYRKDGSVDSGADRGYFYIDKSKCE